MSKCVNSGYCCMVAPCPFGEPTSDSDLRCKFLVPMSLSKAGTSRYLCGKYEEIIDMPGSEIAPAFGAGCCSPIGNELRNKILVEIKDEM